MLVCIFYPSSSYEFTSQVSLLVANSHRPVHQSHLSSPLRLIPLMDGCINRSRSAGRTRSMSWWLFDLFNLLLVCARYHLMFVTLVSDTAQANKFVTCFHLRCQYKIKRTTSIPNGWVGVGGSGGSVWLGVWVWVWGWLGVCVCVCVCVCGGGDGWGWGGDGWGWGGGDGWGGGWGWGVLLAGINLSHPAIMGESVVSVDQSVEARDKTCVNVDKLYIMNLLTTPIIYLLLTCAISSSFKPICKIRHSRNFISNNIYK